MTTSSNPRLPRRFLTLWGGQTVSLVGTDVAGFGVAFFAFLETGSLTWLAALFVAGRIPALVASSHAGGLVDRTSAKAVLIGADLFAGVASMMALALHLAGSLELWHLVVLAVVGSIANAYQLPAYQAAVPTLVDRDVLPKAHGLLQMTPAAGFLAGPALAGVLVAWMGIGGILVFDLVTFLVAMSVTASVHFPMRRVDPAPSPVASSSEPAVSGSGNLRFMWRHLVGRRRGVRHLVLWMAAVNFAATAVNVLIPALLLTVASESSAGFVLAAGGVAMLASGATVSALGLPDRRVTMVVASTALIGLGFVVIAARPELSVVVAGVVLTMATLPLVGAASGTIHQTEVAQEMQGRLTAFRRVVGESLVLPAVIVVTPLVDRVIEPAMQPGGWAAEIFGPLIGVGEGRGLALAMVFAGIGVVAVALGMRLDPWLAALNYPEEPPARGSALLKAPLGC